MSNVQESPSTTEYDPDIVSNDNAGSFEAEDELPNQGPRIGNNEAANAQGDNVPDQPEDAALQLGHGGKKKKKKKPKSKRGLNAPSGFEEFYVDAPLTPDEYDEEKQLYDPSKPFAERIETAIQRFAARRRMDSKRRDLFDKYLAHGGVQSGPKTFGGGLDSNTLETGNADSIRTQMTSYFVDADRGEPGDESWVVDFEGCAKSFLSTKLGIHWELESEEKIKFLVGIIRNFLNYLLHHDVCPDYEAQVHAARKVCDQAEIERYKICKLIPNLPGQFNMACSQIFGGTYKEKSFERQEWMGDIELPPVGLSPEHARNVFKVAIAANANDKIFQRYREQLHNKTYHVTNIKHTGFEITEIVLPTDLIRNLYSQDQHKGLKAIGRMKAKTWYRPNQADEDLTAEEEAALAKSQPETTQYEFWVEEDLLKDCFVGMKFDATVRMLSFGVCFFDGIFSVQCSFHLTIANDLMDEWREPEKEWLPMKRNRYEVSKRESQGNDGEEAAETTEKGGEEKQVEETDSKISRSVEKLKINDEPDETINNSPEEGRDGQ